MRRRTALLPLLLALALVGAACGESKDTGFPPAPEETTDAHGGEGGGEPADEFTTPPPQEGPATELTIQAKNVRFNREEMTFAADEAITLTFQNLDASIPHNVAVYTDDSASEEIFVGETFPGVDERDYEIPATPAGEYFFRCDVHPDMNGTATFE